MPRPWTPLSKTNSRAGCSCSILRVDLHVLGRKIAGPHRRVVAAAGAEIDGHRHFLALQHVGGLRAALVVRDACDEERHGADRDRRAIEDEVGAGTAGGCDKSSPIWIAAVDRGLD